MSFSDLPKDRAKLKYIAFFHVAMGTKEGPAHVFMALDVERDYLINLGVEPEVTDDVVMKHIYLLTEHPEFEPHCKDGFTLVMEDHSKLAQKIQSIIGPCKGTVLFDKALNNSLSNPVLIHLMGSLKNLKKE
ncbi:hypothetical protein WBG78_12730 [Chryseolinea sp. T2]|uniref:hypothetical protein n=1 Tax=Chryseolinea sp. T2 TaxID=3129255 RepID=UPI003076AB45